MSSLLRERHVILTSRHLYFLDVEKYNLVLKSIFFPGLLLPTFIFLANHSNAGKIVFLLLCDSLALIFFIHCEFFYKRFVLHTSSH